LGREIKGEDGNVQGGAVYFAEDGESIITMDRYI
jgi:hypothetical protein